MLNANARNLSPALNTEGDELPRIDRNALWYEFEVRKHRFVKRYALAAILIAGLIIWTGAACLITRAVVRKNTIQEEAEHYAPYLEELTKYKAKEWEDGQATFLSDAKSKAAARQVDAVQLAHDNGLWKNENAFKTYCWNVYVRKTSPFYPDSIVEVLDQPMQYEFHDHNDTYNQEKYLWALEVLEQADTGMMPAYLTQNHVMLEVRNGGNDCVLNTEKGDDPWRYRE